MKVYSDTLTRDDLVAALPEHVTLDARTIRNPRVRRFGWDVNLEGFGSRHTRKVNSGEYGAGYHYAASYDDHGEWMARLFAKDPDARISWWKGLEDFTKGTEGKYSLTAV